MVDHHGLAWRVEILAAGELALQPRIAGADRLGDLRDPEARRLAVAGAARKVLAGMPVSRKDRHRRDAIAAVARHLQAGGTRSLVVIPANGDRERLFPALVAATVRRALLPTTVVLTPTIGAVASILKDLKHVMPPRIPVGYMASKSVRDADDATVMASYGLVTVMTYAGFANEVEKGTIRDGDIDHLVLDEAHEGLSDYRHERLLPFILSSVVSAFTGTPTFDDFKNVHRMLGAENEVFTISAQELRDRRAAPAVINYMVGIRIDGDLPLDHRTAQLSKRKALVDLTLDFLQSGADRDIEAALADRVLLFYGADRSHARMFAQEYARRHRERHRLESLRAYRDRAEIASGKRHNRRRSVMRDAVLAEIVAKGIRDEAGWGELPRELREATDPVDREAHLVAMLEHAANVPAPVEVLTGEDRRVRIEDVLARARRGEVKVIANAQLLEDVEVPNVGVVVNSPTDSMLRCLRQAADLQRGKRTGVVVNPYYLVNGVSDVYLRFFYEASGDVGSGRLVESDPVHFGDIDLDGYLDDTAGDEDADQTPAALAQDGIAGGPLPGPLPPRPEAAVQVGPAADGDARGADAQAAPDREAAEMEAEAQEATRRLAPAGRAFRPVPLPARPRRFTVTRDKESIVRLTRRIGFYRNPLPPDGEHLSLRQACALLSVPTRRNGEISRVYRLVEEDLLHGRPPTFNGAPVGAGIYAEAGKKWLGIHRTDLERIGRSFDLYPDLPRKSPSWLTLAEVAAELWPASDRYLRETFKALAAEWTTTGRPSVAGFSMVIENGRQVFAIRRTSLDLLRAEVARRRPDPVRPGEIRLRDAAIRLGAQSREKAFRGFWEATVARLREGKPADEDETVAFRLAQDGRRTIGVVAESALPWLARKTGLRYGGVVAFDPAVHARMTDALAWLEAAAPEADAGPAMRRAFERLRTRFQSAKPVLVGGDRVSATLVRIGRETDFALPRDCLLALALEAGIEVPLPPFGDAGDVAQAA